MRQQKDETSEVFTEMFSGGDEGDSDLVRRAFAGDAFDKPLGKLFCLFRWWCSYCDFDFLFMI